MKIDKSIVFVVLEGNVKEKVKNLPYSFITNYEALRNETCVIVEVEPYTNSFKNEMEKQVKLFYKRYGRIKSCKYYKDGADIIQMTSNN